MRGYYLNVMIILLSLIPLLLYTGLIMRLPVTQTLLWFSATTGALILYVVFSLLKKTKTYISLAVFSGGLLIAVIIEWTGYRWLHIAYIPYTVLVSLIFSPKVLLMLTISLVFLELRHLINPVWLYEEISLLSSAILSGGLSYLLTYRIKREKERLSSSLKTLRGSAIESLSSEDLINRGIAINMEFDEELRDMLTTIRHTVNADSVRLYVPKEGELTLRCSTSHDINDEDGNLSKLVFSRKEPILLGGAEQGRKPSISAIPIMNENFAIGVLIAESKTSALEESELTTLKMFSRHIARLFEKQRIYLEMERSHFGIKTLHEQSSELISSLKLDVIIKKILNGVYKIAPLSIYFFLNGLKGYELLTPQYQITPYPKEKTFLLKDTLIERAINEKEHIYIPDLKDYALALLPFKAGRISSAFILPLIYEVETLGVIVLISGNTNPLSSYQIELLEVFGNQAVTSLKNALLHARLERMAITDSLTGLFNHRYFQERLSSEFKRLERSSEPLSLLLIDIDYFKKVNDTYGHPVGDQVLWSVSDLIRKTIREIDLPARYGGEEFATLLIGTDKTGALKMAERLRKTVMSSEQSADGEKFRVTVSIGIGVAPFDAKTKEALIECADSALYEAKRAGRNRVVLWKAD